MSARQRGEAFARATVTQLNAWHTTRTRPPGRRVPTCRQSWRHDWRVSCRTLGVPTMPALPAPRRTMLDWYFRAGGIDGMTNPFGLEVLLNSRVLPVELPALAAHEYAHLAGFADEADASVVAWLACQGGSPALRYSSALAVLPHLLTGLPRETQRAVIGGPRGWTARGPAGDRRPPVGPAAVGACLRVADLRPVPAGQPGGRGHRALRRRGPGADRRGRSGYWDACVGGRRRGRLSR